MRSPTALDILQTAHARRSERHEGVPRAAVEFTATRVANLQIANMNALPCSPTTLTLQNEAGEFLFLLDWSMIGGPDVLG